MNIRQTALALVLFLCHAAAPATEVAVCTDNGRFTLELFDERAPNHVESFLGYVDVGFYSNTVFHRVINGFVVQGGGYDRGLQAKQAGEPVENESRNGLNNTRGTLAAARTANPHSASSQFFINLRDNPTLDASESAWGYTVFGRVSDGMEVIDEIARLPTRSAGPFTQDVPEPLVGVWWMTRLDRAALEALPAEGREATIRERIAAAEDPVETARWVSNLRAICTRFDADLLLTEARASIALERPERARSVLTEYFSAAGTDHPGRDEATALYAQLAGRQTSGLSDAARQLAQRCTEPAVPDIPDGTTASYEEMVEGQQQVQSYVAQAEAYLDCLNQVIDDPDSGLSAEDRNALVAGHNTTVGLIEAAAAQFNQELRTFRERQND
jgi:peptidyl-prolyl cis-trans isomerase B (cyclophilin B)